MILIIDFGSQFTQLVARRVRELGVYSKILSYKNEEQISEIFSNLKNSEVKGVIFSGGPFSVYENNAPSFTHSILNIDIPILGICYGFQLINFLLGGKVESAEKREYGFEVIHPVSSISYDNFNPIFPLVNSNNKEHKVWMSHGDEIKQLAPNLIADSYTRGGVVASFHHATKQIFGLQFHPEVEHSECGKEILKHFIEVSCNCKKNWNANIQIESIVNLIKNKISFIDKNTNELPSAICALSGGVDSCVAAVLCSLVFGEKLKCIFIDNGLLRKNEFEDILNQFKIYLNLNVKGVDASKLFLDRLKDVTDSEQKRKIIGQTFIEVFEEEAKSIPNAKYLIQGTLYPDVVESVPVYGANSTIKTHHNVGGLPERMSFELIEPLRELFKDEVRRLGRELQIPDNLLLRHPFPGPGLAVRILGNITQNKLNVLKEADAILVDELKKNHLYNEVWQAFVVLLPVHTVGVMGDARTYENVAAIRCVNAVDGMTADWSRLPHEFLAHVSSRITNEVKGINRVVYDVTSKPPATIEWE